MTKTKSTKRALLMSALALFACVSMLVGSTFAWFTDSVTSGNNVIKSGKLEVALLDDKGDSLEGESLEFVDETGKVLSNILWEPGCTYTLQPVFVKNIGNLALKYEIVISGIEGDAKLLEAIEWTVGGAALKGTLEPNAMTAALQITGHMKEEAGNEYQDLTMEGISITVYATQFNSESDSFGPDYDKDAPLLFWDGTIDTSWYNADATTYELSSPAKLAGLAKLVNEGNSFAGKTIKLAADMDLNNIAWTPIGIKIDEDTTNSFNGKLYGNGFTIYNLNVSGTTGVGLVGFAGNAAHIEGIHIVGASVTGENSVGAVLGYGYLAKDCLKYCTVEDAIVYAGAGTGKEDGDKVGAVAGWTSNGNIIGNKAINCEVYGCRDMGGIVGYVNGENRAVEVSGNTVENVTVSVIKAEGYNKVLGSNINTAVGRTGSNVTVKSNSGEITKEENVTVASTSTELKDAAAAGGEVVVVAGNYTFPGNSIAEDSTLICNPGTVFEGKTSLNINGATVVGATFTSDNQYLVNQSTVNGTFKDCVFTDSDGLRSCYAGETVVFENCVFDTDFYGVHFDSGNNDVVFKNCTFSGFNTFGSALTKLTLEDCTFKYNGKGGYNGINLWGDTEMTNCTFVFDGSASNEWVDLCYNNKTVTFTNCVVTDGKTEKGVETVVGNYGTGNTIIIDNEEMCIASDNAVLDDAITNGETEINLGSGSYIIPDSAQGKTLTIVGNGDTVIASQDDGAAEGDCDYSFSGSTVTFENVTITTSTTYFPGYARMKGTYNNCTINGVWTLYDNSEFNDCTFNVSGDVYNVWTWGAAEATFNGCTFNNDGKAILLYGGANTKLTVNGCTFNDNGGLTDLKAAIEIGNDYGTSFELIVNDTVVNGYEINDKGINTGTTLWANKNSMPQNKLNVVVDGVDVY